MNKGSPSTPRIPSDEQMLVELIEHCAGTDDWRWMDKDQQRRAATLLRRLFDSSHASEIATHPDTKRMDWLEMQAVSVRTPLVHGSRHHFLAAPEQGDGEEIPSPIRAMIDTALGVK